MKYRILGTLEVRRGGVGLHVGGSRRRALLAALLVKSGRVATTDYLARAVWEQPPRSMHANLRTHLAALRRVLAGPGDDHDIVSHPDGYQLLVRPDQFDLAVFEALRERGRRAEQQGFLDLAARQYASALALWRGDVLDGVRGGGPALLGEAAAVQERRLATVERWVEVRLAQGACADAVEELYRLVAAYPLREVFWGQLMRGLHAAGRRAEALGAYQRARAHCVEKLGVEPGQALRGLHGRILDGVACAEPVRIGCGAPTGW